MGRKGKNQEKADSVMNLVRSAGIDVSDWKNFKKGENPQRASRNPKYCYEWAFIEKNKVAVLNLWKASGVDKQTINYKEEANRLRLLGTKSIWVKRAKWVDDVIRQAVEQRLPLRVIMCEGTPRGLEKEASQVSKRTLDTSPWSIEYYNPSTGECSLRRGISPTALADQFSIPNYETSVVDRKPISGEAYDRDSEVCKSARERAQGKCEFCSEIGFIRPDGKIFLEVHHIVPLSEGGNDISENVAALCPNHHREAHLGRRANDIKKTLINLRLSEARPSISYSMFLEKISRKELT